jgi:diadenosine tetraphosphate (Ap4A) HIT family hydrolase
MPTERVDYDAVRRALGDRCFICEMLAGNPDYQHHVVYEDDTAVAFLNRFPVVVGYALVAPKQHREHVTGDFSNSEFLAVQSVVHRVGEAIRTVVPTERLYVLSLGSQQGNSHVHWHLVPLPPGVPFEEQQLRFIDTDEVVVIPTDELEQLADALRAAANDDRRSPTPPSGSPR